MRFQNTGNKEKILSFQRGKQTNKQTNKNKLHKKNQNCLGLSTHQKREGNGGSAFNILQEDKSKPRILYPA